MKQVAALAEIARTLVGPAEKLRFQRDQIVICPDCGKFEEFRRRCPKCGGEVMAAGRETRTTVNNSAAGWALFESNQLED